MVKTISTPRKRHFVKY